ncbi:ArsR/SmtB family transcription factor [Anaerostipes sp.]|uniref:ArsR/SmtB family transcription factor n=1 Tax=Anaerostipes sp. TaxID=1872530 RepID=UPI0025C01842|nr:metalloregulator ArsR/SmtB family transcription factor [Anaerostipes sp.]MBS7007710.1 winged helix-turn-helix transcriptional regulator [Anaerostipes sp.]
MEKDCEKRLNQIVQGFTECKDAFTAIGDETRQLILLVLLESDLSGIRVGEIARKTHLTRPSVSHHLKILKEANIVAVRKEGTKNFYYISLDETRWGKVAGLINLICESIECSSGTSKKITGEPL